MKTVNWFIKTHLGRMLLGLILIVLGGIMTSNGTIGELIWPGFNSPEIFDYIMYVGYVLAGFEVARWFFHAAKNTITSIFKK